MFEIVSTENVHEPGAPAGMVAPVRVTAMPEAMALTTPLAQVVAVLGAGATNRPEGRLSVSTAAVSAVEFGLLIVTVRRVTWPARTGEIENALVIVAGFRTLRTALTEGAGLTTAPPLAVTPPGGMVLVNAPVLVPITWTVRVQDDGPAGKVPPVRLNVVAPAAGLKVPPQLLVAPGAGATCMLAGRLSVSETPLNATW